MNNYIKVGCWLLLSGITTNAIYQTIRINNYNLKSRNIDKILNLGSSIGIGLGLWCHVLHKPIMNYYLKKN